MEAGAARVIDLTSPDIPFARPLELEDLGPPPSVLAVCGLQGCRRPVYVDDLGVKYAFCSRSHGRTHRQRLEAEHARAPTPLHPRPVLPAASSGAPPSGEAPASAPLSEGAASAVITADLPTQERVLKQRNWMAKQLQSRTEPRPCRFNGTRPCPLCNLPFRIGQELVKCYAHGGGAPPWVHVECVNEILGRQGRPPIP